MIVPRGWDAVRVGVRVAADANSIARRSPGRRGRDSGQGSVPVPMGEQHATGRIRFESLKT